MLCQLRRHRDTPCDAVDSIEIEVQREAANLLLRYRVRGRIPDIIVPPTTTPSRGDELWKHTCFEAFVRSRAEGYREFNFSPSTEWAAYAFSGYRQGMQPLPLLPPEITTQASDVRFGLRAAPKVEGTTHLRVGLSAVIEEANGRKSYWALAHPPGKPDFHHPDCFALELPPASRT